MSCYVILIVLVAVERLAELVIARSNLASSLERGGIEFGGHYPWMVLLHTGLLLGCMAEVFWLQRPFVPLLGWPMLALLVAAQGLRWWCIRTLGYQWNTRVVIVPGVARVARGPYRLMGHPNYLAVVVEGVALPLVHTAWLTALVFTVLNFTLLNIRIRTENDALAVLR